MKSIAVMNLKGGAGKTTTAINVATILATEYDQQVLVIDADGQGNATKSLLPGDTICCCLSLSDYLEAPCKDMWRLYISPSIIRNLDIVPGDTGLWKPGILPEGPEGNVVLRSLRDSLIEADAYDYVIMDCPPGLSAINRNAIIASDVIIIPSCMDGYSDDGAKELVAQIGLLRETAPSVRIGGVLLTKWVTSDVGRLHETLLRDGSGLNVYSTVIRNSPKAPDSTYGSGPIVTYSPRSYAAIDYRKFVHEFVRREEALAHGKA